jgi:hypothetical protein
VADDEPTKLVKLEVGDIVREHQAIIPPDRSTWTGIVVFIERSFYDHLFYNEGYVPQDSVGIHWFQAGYVEQLPSSVVELVQRAKQKTDKNS